MRENIIQILKAGNQELFYSSFIAWLLDAKGDHGLGEQCLKWFFNKIDMPPQDVDEILPEKGLGGGCRADIFICTKDGLKIALENKTKSFGTCTQLDAYKKYVDVVVPVGLVAENFPAEKRHKVITYNDILDFLRQATIEHRELSVLVHHFRKYLEAVLAPFDIFDRFCREEITLEQARCLFEQGSVTFSQNENDRRFFQAVYFERLIAYISTASPNLIFDSSAGYYTAQSQGPKPIATRWIIEKNMQGPAFMESIICQEVVPGKLRLLEKWKSAFLSVEDHSLCPRLELWSGPDDFLTREVAGIFNLGAWDDLLKETFHNSGEFRKRGTRNFHYRELAIPDLPYKKMTALIKAEMGKVWEVQPDRG